MKNKANLFRPAQRRAVALPLAFTLALAGGAHAATIYWDNTDGTADDWGSLPNWSTVLAGGTDPGALPGASDLAIFSATPIQGTNQTLNLNADRSVLGLNVLSGMTATTTLLGGGTARTLTLGGSGITIGSGAGAVTLGDGTAGNNVLISLASGAQTWRNNSANHFTINNTAVASFSRVAGATLVFHKASSGNFAISTTHLPITNSIAGPWAFFGTGTVTRYANITSGNITGFTGTNQNTGNNWTVATTNYEVFTTTTQTLTGNKTANTLRYNAAGLTISLGASGAFNLTTNGILAVGGSGTLTISRSGSSTGTLAIGSTNELVIAGPQAVTISAPISGASRHLTYSGTNTLTLSGVNTYTGTTTVNSGFLTLFGGGTLATTNLTVNNGGTFNYLPTTIGTIATLGTGSTLNLASGGSIGLSWDASTSSKLNALGAASVGNGVALNMIGTYSSDTTYTVLEAASGLDSGSFYVTNPTDYTAAFVQTATNVTVTPTSATALTTAYWKGGLSGFTNVWSVSNGSTQSNWVASSGGPDQSLVPGSGADVFISNSTVTTSPNPSVLGANMSIKSLTVADTTNGLTLNADGFGLTIGSGGITVASGVPVATTIGVPLTLNGSQNFTNNSDFNLKINDTVTGTGSPTITNNGTGSGAVEFAPSDTASIAGSVSKIVQDSATSALRLRRASPLFSGGVEVKKGTVAMGNYASNLGTGTLTLGDAAGGSAAATLDAGDNSNQSFANQIVLASTTTGTLKIRLTEDQVGTSHNKTFTGGITGTNSLTLENNGGNDPIGRDTLTFSTGAINNVGSITHIGSGSGDTTINSDIGSNVTGVTQNSATSKMVLTGTNTYAGDTTVSAGILAVDGDAIPNTGKLVINGGKVDPSGATETVGTLFFGAAQQIAGTWGSTTSTATNQNDTYFTGTGVVEVNTGPSGGYTAWQAANSTAGGLNDDHDNDGVDNGVEWFLGGNANTSGFTALPAVANTGGTLSVTWTKSADYPGDYGTDFRVETSATLANPWTPATEGVGAGFVEITGNNVKFTFPAGVKDFARLVVTGP